ncbi:MAG: heavy metal translocating P-type ATPase [Marmoricola sp.]
MTALDSPPLASAAQRRAVPRRSVLQTAASLPEARWAALAVVLFALGGIAQLLGAPPPVWWALYLACYVAGGWEPALAGLQALRARTLDVDVLMIVAALAAAAIGQVLDGALLIVIFATSGALEAFVTRRTADSVTALLELAPDRATRVAHDGSLVEVDVAALNVDDLVLVRPGDRIAADGVVVDGESEVDQATITGEPMPVPKAVGAEVFAGTVNGTGSLTVRVGARAEESVVARIVAMVEEASQTKARSQLFIEKVEERYSLVVVAATLLIVAVPLLRGAAFQPSLLRAMTFMIVASPCAVVLATMPPLLGAIANAGRHGVLVKSAVALEALRDARVVAFDKTGTVTHGTPVVLDAVAFGAHSADEVLAAAAAVEQHSEHPLARAVVAAAHDRSLPLRAANDVRARPGVGVTARLDGRHVEVGRPAESTAGAVGDATIVRWEEAGHTAVVVTVDGAPWGAIALVDEIRASAPPTVERLTALGVRSVLLSGDHPRAAQRVGMKVGIEDARGGLLPTDKARAVAALQASGDEGARAGVVLVGDGINDAPAMATADVAVAMGRRGADLAVETGDLSLVHDDIAALPTVMRLADRAHRVVRANLVFAACVILALVTWDFVGHLPLPLGVAGHEGSTVVVGLNGLRLLRRSVWRDAAR